ncbi:hypothetical protein A9264_03275 [Vibrio sp. UCD-FRSSP16_10]|uniref:hypothetical protein n=1 Tax=unclassified Vibrio TaxID=2614977 RepID=UPI0007FEC2EC|nr:MULTISPECIES: hypothetical protein [unclassified Vibrio]OBT12171.1 hypothetical protein A9260_04725 [Vibrio sp. UCD-FRSSP16_30]OBT20502.1 hypothetical protein A9264_03275 [Vibrio sp. UCD-FRSSP16_10]
MMKVTVSSLTKWCAYSHMFKVLSALINGGDISDQTRAGRNIALLGLFCPFFWYALFTGANKAELTFHALHSGVVFLIGIVIMFFSLRHKKES